MSSPSKGKVPGYLLIPGSPTMRSKSPTMPALSPSSSSPPSPGARPPPLRAQTAVSATSLIVPSTPFYTPQVSSVNVGASRRLLLPTVRATRPPVTSPRISSKAYTKAGRSRAGSLSVNVSPEPQERTPSGASSWLPGGDGFEIVEEQLELEGFQIFAVEKWYARRICGLHS